ncbi:pentapeptide MXKDX repeat protein [Fulvimonas yonginensis]
MNVRTHAALAFAAALALTGLAPAFAQDAMPAGQAMATDAMHKDAMQPQAMEHGAMKHAAMKQQGMHHESMKPGEAMAPGKSGGHAAMSAGAKDMQDKTTDAEGH